MEALEYQDIEVSYGCRWLYMVMYGYEWLYMIMHVYNNGYTWL